MSTHLDPCDMLTEMSGCAYRLGRAFAAEAERAEDWARRHECFQLFDRCFFAVRVAIALQLRLERPAAAPQPAVRSEAEDLREREDPPERDRAEYERPDRERLDADRETERASLPILLKTLTGVVADASALPGPQPAELPTLRELLAEVTRDTPLVPHRAQAVGLRARLAGSATLATSLAAGATLAPPSRPASVARRPATGPPRR